MMIPSAHNNSKRIFFQFAAVHALLMGLLPFFIPVLLWQQGIELWQLCFFIAITAVGFLLVLPLWQRIYINQNWHRLFALSFILEALLLVILLYLPTDNIQLFSASLLLAALLNGAYLCFYWTSQRTLFSYISRQENSGNTFGNFQIVVMVLLKVGIIASAFLLESGYKDVLLLLSLALSSISFLLFRRINITTACTQTTDSAYLGRNELDNNTRRVFIFDGVFLYLESYFWLLSLYLIAQQDLMQLGFIVVSLSILLAIIFWFIKAKIDALPANLTFQLAIIGYALSWFIRGVIDVDSMTEITYPVILLVAFLTSFFRLSFNKRFFDIAQHTDTIGYLIAKSLYSQWGIALFFAILALALILFEPTFSSHSDIKQLASIYFVAAPFALFYGLYSMSFTPINKVNHHA